MSAGEAIFRFRGTRRRGRRGSAGPASSLTASTRPAETIRDPSMGSRQAGQSGLCRTSPCSRQHRSIRRLQLLRRTSRLIPTSRGHPSSHRVRPRNRTGMAAGDGWTGGADEPEPHHSHPIAQRGRTQHGNSQRSTGSSRGGRSPLIELWVKQEISSAI